MCLTVYLASDIPLPLIKWSKDKPSLHVKGLTPSKDSVKTQFEIPHIYYLGSNEGCGCGFFKRGRDGYALKSSEENYSQLNVYLKKAKSLGAQIQIYACWDGDENTEPEFRNKIELEHLIESNFEFKENTLYEIL
jgi:hypothetical protein